MLKIKIGNKEIEYANSLETEEFYNGSSRRTLTVNCPSGAIGLDELNALLIEENLSEITMTNTEGIPVYKKENTETQEIDHYDPIINTLNGYVLKISCGIESVLVEPEAPDTPAVYDEQVVFKVAKRTYIEEQLMKLGVYK